MYGSMLYPSNICWQWVLARQPSICQFCLAGQPSNFQTSFILYNGFLLSNPPNFRPQTCLRRCLAGQLSIFWTSIVFLQPVVSRQPYSLQTSFVLKWVLARQPPIFRHQTCLQWYLLGYSPLLDLILVCNKILQFSDLIPVEMGSC